MQKKTEELQLAIQDYFDVDWFSMKCYMRRQIAKCVNECKSQAANAKRIVGTIKHHRPKRKPTDADVAGANGNWESDDDFDYWDSDFDEDFDDEPEEDGLVSENNGVITNQEQGEQMMESPTSSVKEEPVIPVVSVQNGISLHSSPNNLQQVAASGPSICNSVQQTPVHRTIQRAPIKRPQSGPPPPPVPQPSTQGEAPTEEYEIPISYPPEVGSVSLPCRNQISAAVQESSSSYMSPINHSPRMVNGCETAETYEIIEPCEENYEIVQGPPIPVKPPEKPNLPPRLLQTTINSLPPPLPLKPKKLQESLSSHYLDGSRSLNRPKLPTKQQEEDSGNDSSNLSGLGSSIISSILGRRNSNSSSSLPRSLHSRDRNSSDSILSIGATNISVDGQAANSTPEKDGFFTVGSSAFISCSTTATAENSKLQSPKQDELAQNMATRPLPPVPQIESKSSPTRQGTIASFAWFHEVEREDAEHQIRSLVASGSFLVRPSRRAGQENPYTLTILHNGKVFHLNIRLRPDDTFALGKEKKKEKTFLAVPDLIAYHQIEPILLTSRGECAGQTILGAYPEK